MRFNYQIILFLICLFLIYQYINKLRNNNSFEYKKNHKEIQKNNKVDVDIPLTTTISQQLSENKLCSWVEVECLGACVSAPMMQINQDYFEDLDENNAEEIIQRLLKDEFPEPGSAKNRKNNAPEKGKTTLLEVKNA